MNAELIGIIAVGVALAGLIFSAALWLGSWLRDVARRLARLEGLIEGAALFRPAHASSTGD